MRALAEPRLHLVRRSEDDKGRLRAEIVIDDIRRMIEFFHLSAIDGGRRVVIIDAADDMNPQSANAVLKMLEEPPRDAMLLLISDQPGRLLPTIRSRCRLLSFDPLGEDDVAQRVDLRGQGDGRDQPDAVGENEIRDAERRPTAGDSSHS